MSRRASKASLSDGEFILECKAAYLSVFDDIKDEIQSQDELIQVLQQAGRNPSTRVLNKYWTSNSDSLTYDDFVDICRKEPITTTDDLMKAFRKIDINGDGYISLDELFKLMTTKGEKMSRSEVKKIIDEVDENKDGKLDYGEDRLYYEQFCKMIVNTTEEFKKMSRKIMEKKEKKRKALIESQKRGPAERPMSASQRSTTSNKGISSSRRSLLSVGDKGLFTPVPAQRKSILSRLDTDEDDLPKPSPRSKTGSKSKCEAASKLRLAEPKNLREWKTLSSKGMFFVDEDDGSILSHQFTLDLTESSKVWLTIEPGTCKSLAHLDGPLDTSLFVLRSRPDQEGNILATFTEHRDGKGKYGVRCELSAGTYQLIPFTTGCRLGKRTKEPSEAKSLLQKKDGKYALSKAFRKALEDIFDLSDLDDNGLISREEFNLYNLRTSEEEVGDEEWEVVEERLELEKGEITKNGFLQLNELEAEDSNGDEDDMWVTLESMGFNKQLVMDEAHPFKLTVHIEDNDDADIEVAGIEPMIKKVEKALIQSVIDKCEPTKIKGMKDLFLYTYTGEARSTVILDNKSYSSVKLELDCQGSKNVLTNQESMEETFTIKGNSQQIAFHFIPEDESSEWSVKSNETILK